MALPKISYINGQYLPHSCAAIHVEDRGILFSDGVYEGIALINGGLLDADEHFNRLEYSLNVVDIEPYYSVATLKIIIFELARLNNLKNGFVYVQITRGSAPRNHFFPRPSPKPSLYISILDAKTPSSHDLQNGMSIITQPDIRWGRRDAKTISLLPNILAKEAARKAQAKEAWLYNNDGIITEGSSSNAFIIDEQGALRTHCANHDILGGITRMRILELARELDIQILENAFTRDELLTAREAFATSTTMRIMPVTKINGNELAVGDITRKLMNIYNIHIGTIT